MSIRLTESRLRQIIREESAKLTRRSAGRISESSMYGRNQAAATQFGARYYIDYDIVDDEGLLARHNPGDNVIDVIADEYGMFDGILSPTEHYAVLLNKSGPAGGHPVVRFYGTGDDITMLAAAIGEMEGDAPREDLIKPLKFPNRPL